jgi:hypothetical protein
VGKGTPCSEGRAPERSYRGNGPLPLIIRILCCGFALTGGSDSYVLPLITTGWQCGARWMSARHCGCHDLPIDTGMAAVLYYASEASTILAFLLLPGACAPARERARGHRRGGYHPHHVKPTRSRCCRRYRPGSLPCLAVGKRSAAIAILLALAVGVVIGLAWYEPRGAGLADSVRTWVGFIRRSSRAR